MNKTTIAIIGAGRVGTTTAYALMLNNLAAEILLVDANEIRCKGEFLDLEDVLPFCSTSSIKDGTFAQAAQADIIIVTAGAAQNPGQSRLELLQINKKICDQIIQQLTPLNPNAIIIVVSNPVDILTLYIQQKNILAINQIFGSGTFLDSTRLQVQIAKRFNIAPQSVHALILGEHGDSQFPAWSLMHCDGKSIYDMPNVSQKELDDLAMKTKQKAYDIIACKGATFYGIASCLATIVESITFDKKAILPVSWFYKKAGICLSLPYIVGKNGIVDSVTLTLQDQEEKQLENSILALKKQIDFS